MSCDPIDTIRYDTITMRYSVIQCHAAPCDRWDTVRFIWSCAEPLAIPHASMSTSGGWLHRFLLAGPRDTVGMGMSGVLHWYRLGAGCRIFGGFLYEQR